MVLKAKTDKHETGREKLQKDLLLLLLPRESIKTKAETGENCKNIQ